VPPAEHHPIGHYSTVRRTGEESRAYRGAVTLRPFRLLGQLLASLSLLALVSTLLPQSASALGAPGSCGRPSGCNRYELIHAGSTYAWWTGRVIRHEFETTGEQLSDAANPVPGPFSHTGTPTMWAKRYGTLETHIEAPAGDVTTDWNQSRRYGRWEVRFRSKTGDNKPKTPAGLPPYAIKIELVPSGAPARCAPESVVLASYAQTPGSRATVGLDRPGLHRSAVATPSGPLFDVNDWNPTQDSRYGAWRVWAVEVTKKSVSWFLDGRIIRRLPIKNAMRGQRLHLRISDLGTPGFGQMDPLVTQTDWFRYYPLGRTTTKKRLVRQLRRAPRPAATAGYGTVGC